MRILFGDTLLADRIKPADSFWKRFRGLMGCKELGEGEGLLLFRCPSIHCFFMKIPIDAVYLSADMRVMGIETLKPWSVGRVFRGTRHVLELPAGRAAAKRLAVGDVLQVVDSEKKYRERVSCRR